MTQRELLDIPEWDWVRKEFGDDPLFEAGLVDVSGLPILDKIAILNLTGALRLYRPGLRGLNLDLYIVAAPDPVAKVYASRTFNLAVAVVSVGLVRLLAGLAARLAVIAKTSSVLSLFLQPTNKSYQISSFPHDGSHEFALSSGKRRCSGLTDQNVRELAGSLRDNTALLFTELLSAALEFIVLHEAAHIVLRHREAGELFRMQQSLFFTLDQAKLVNWEGKEPAERFRPEIRLARCFEHQADYLALITMCQFAPLRPCLYGTPLSGRWVGSTCTSRNSRRNLGLMGAALSLALVTLLEAPEPDSEFHPRLTAAGTHPAAVFRFAAATTLFVEAIRSPFRRLLVWPSFVFRDYAKQLGIVQWTFSIAAMGCITDDWEGIASRPGKEWPAFLQRLYLDQEAMSAEAASELQRDFVRANELVRSVRKTWSSGSK